MGLPTDGVAVLQVAVQVSLPRFHYSAEIPPLLRIHSPVIRGIHRGLLEGTVFQRRGLAPPQKMKEERFCTLYTVRVLVLLKQTDRQTGNAHILCKYTFLL